MNGVRFGHIATDYHTDDFYQRMLDFGSGRMNSGACHGGPLHGKQLHHPEESYRVATDQLSLKPVPGVVSSANPDVKFGLYRFAYGRWTWHE